MALSIAAIKNIDLGQAWQAGFVITLSGSYGAGGESLAGKFSAFEFKSTQTPIHLIAEDTSGYVFRYVKATNKLKILTCGANAQDAFVELTAAGYPGALTSDVITGTAWFEKK